MAAIALNRGVGQLTRAVSLSVLLGLPALETGVARADDSPEFANKVWREFRKAHRLHSDLIGISAANASGQRVLIIAEPPERVTLAQVRAVLAPYAEKVQTASHAVMHGGTVTDIVATLKPRIDDGALRAMSEDIHELLFATARRARLVQLPAQAPRVLGSSLDLQVTADELHRFLLLEDHKLQSGVLEAPTTLRNLLAKKSRGVYQSAKAPGFVIWALPRGGDISALADQLREFSVAGDVVLGAVADRNTVGIVARLRQEPLQRLPAVRNDTVQLLAAVSATSVSQSYERNMWPSGSSSDSFDRAPIYLSAELRHTEYGSLLNIVDQLLKGWSQAGKVVYKDFAYPRPPSFPFGAATASSTEPSSPDGFLFNWNTEGVFYTLDVDHGMEITALHRTGSLPVIYGSTQKRRLATEATGYRWFASVGDANVARVVQYAALFAVFKRYGITSDWLAGKQPGDAGMTSILVAASTDALNGLLNLRQDEAVWNKAKADSASAKELFARAQEALDAVLAVPEDVRESTIATYARLLGDPRGYQQDIAQRAYSTLRNTYATAQDRDRAERTMTMLEHCRALERFLSRTGIGALIADKIELWNAMEAHAEKSTRGWIKTAAVVASKDSTAKAIGGHNIDAAMVSLKPDSSLQAGKVLARMDKSGEVIITYSPADRGKVAALSRKVSELQGKSVGEAEAALEQVVRATPALNRRLPEAIGADAPAASSRVDYRLVSAADDVQRVRATASPSAPEQVIAGPHRPTVFVRRMADHYQVTSTESTDMYTIGSNASLHQIIVDHARAGSFQAGQARVVFTEFAPEKAANIIHSVKSRMSRVGNADPQAEAIFISHTGRNPEILLARQQWAKAEIDTAGITTRFVTSGRLAGSTEMVVPVRLPAVGAGRPPLLVRVLLYFKGSLSALARSEIVATLRAAMRDLGDMATSIADCRVKLRSAMKKAGIDPADVELRIDADDILVGQVHDAPPRQEGA